MSRHRNPIVHLELHTPNLPRALGFYTSLFEWESERIETGSVAYQALDLGERMEGGVVESDSSAAPWLRRTRGSRTWPRRPSGRRSWARTSCSPRARGRSAGAAS